MSFGDPTSKGSTAQVSLSGKKLTTSKGTKLWFLRHMNKDCCTTIPVTFSWIFFAAARQCPGYLLRLEPISSLRDCIYKMGKHFQKHKCFAHSLLTLLVTVTENTGSLNGIWQPVHTLHNDKQNDNLSRDAK